MSFRNIMLLGPETRCGLRDAVSRAGEGVEGEGNGRLCTVCSLRKSGRLVDAGLRITRGSTKASGCTVRPQPTRDRSVVLLDELS